jgi:hypothetical protein
MEMVGNELGTKVKGQMRHLTLISERYIHICYWKRPFREDITREQITA